MWGFSNDDGDGDGNGNENISYKVIFSLQLQPFSLNPPWSQWGIGYFGFSQTWILMYAFLSIGWFSLATESESEPGTFPSSENSVLIPLTTRSLTIKWKSQAEAEELHQSQSVGMSIVIGFSFRFRFRLRQSGFHYFVRIGSYLNAILCLINNKLL